MAGKSVYCDGWPRYQRMGQVHGAVFLSGNVYELDPHFPDLYFQTSFIINDEAGDSSLSSPHLHVCPTPHDVRRSTSSVREESLLRWSRHLWTPAVRCVREILYGGEPRVGDARCGVLLHSSSEVGGRPTPKDIAKCARAYENMCCVVSSNTSAIHDSPVPENSTQGHSQIVDFKGQVMTEAYTGESMVGNLIDIERLPRHAKRR